MLTNWGESVKVRSLNKENMGDAVIKSISMLGSGEAIEWEQQEDGLVLKFPKSRPCKFAYTFKISFDKMAGENLESEASNQVMKHG
jgi:alpha-L-fucosidase